MSINTLAGSLLGEAGIERCGNCGFIHILAYEDELYHPVAVFGIPVAGETRLCLHKNPQLVFGGSGIP